MKYIKQDTLKKIVVLTLTSLVLLSLVYSYGAKASKPSPIQLSKPSGFYTEDIDVSIEGIPEGYLVYYTLDGSKPTTSSKPYIAGSSIHITDASSQPNHWCVQKDFSLTDYYVPSEIIDKCVNLRAILYSPDHGYQNEVSASYYIFDENHQLLYANLPTISIMSEPADFFDPKKGIYCIGKNPESPNWESGRNVPGRLNIIGNNSKFRLPTVDNAMYGIPTSLQIRGNISASTVMKAIGFTDPKGNNWLLRPANSLLTDAVLFPILKKRYTFEAPVTQPVNVFLCGEYWGLYVLEQRIDENFISDAYHINKDNLTVAKNKETMFGDRRIGNRYMSLREDVWKLNWEDEASHSYMLDHIDMQNFIDYYASEIYINDQDSSEIYNYVAFRENSGYTNWRYCLYDLDSSLQEPDWNSLTDGNPLRAAWTENMIIHEWLNNLEFRCRFINTLMDLGNYDFNMNRIEADLDKYYNTIAPSIPLQETRYPGYIDSDFDNSRVRDIDEIKDFFERRFDYIQNYVQDFFGLGDAVEITISADKPFRLNSTIISDSNVIGNKNCITFIGTYYSDVPIILDAEEQGHWKIENGEDSFIIDEALIQIMPTDKMKITLIE